MSYSLETAKVVASGDGVGFTYPFTMRIFDSTDLEVTITDANGVNTVVTEGSGPTNYSVSVSSYPGAGNVIYPADLSTPLTSSEKITVALALPHIQETVLAQRRKYDPKAVEYALDRVAMMSLQQQDLIDRSLKLPIQVTGVSTTLGEPSANKYLKWNAAEDAIEAAAISVASAAASSATPQDVSLTAGAAGTNADFARDDHVHLLPVVSIAKGGTGATTASAALAALGAVDLTAANVFTNDNTFKDTDAGALVGPEVTLFRDSATPAAADAMGAINFDGRESGAVQYTYARIFGGIVDPTATSEDGDINFATSVAGVLSTAFVVGAGVYTAGATGGDMGADTMNATSYRVEGGNPIGVWEYIASYSGAAVANLDIEDAALFDSTYVMQKMVIKATVDTDDVEIWARVKQGGSYLSASVYTWSGILNFATVASGDAGSGSDTQMKLTGTPAVSNGVGNDTDEGFFAEIYWHNLGDTTRPIAGRLNAMWWQTGTILSHMDGFIGTNATASPALQGIRFLPESGNFANISVEVYGLRAS